MGSISAKKLESSLAKARGAGIVEDQLTIGDCHIVMRNLLPDEYESVLEECSELEDMRYLNKFQEGHVCRAIVELNGMSLRDIQFVECEEPDPKKPDNYKVIKKELHDYLRENVVRTWSKEALFVAYRKFTDLVVMAENEAKKSVTFLTPDETGEEKYRRLLAEAKETENEVPPLLVTQILQENGYTRYTPLEEMKSAMAGLDSMAKDEEPSSEPEPQESEPQEEPQEPAPEPVSKPSEPPPGIFRRKAPVAQEETTPAPVAGMEAPRYLGQPPIAPNKRSAEFLQTELEVDPTMLSGVSTGKVYNPHAIDPEASQGRVILETPTAAKDEKVFNQAMAAPPVVGLNPKFRPPPRS